MRFLFSEKALLPYRVIVCAFIIVGATLKVDLVWALADLFNGLMVIPNLIALIALHKVVGNCLDDFEAKLAKYEKTQQNISQLTRVLPQSVRGAFFTNAPRFVSAHSDSVRTSNKHGRSDDSEQSRPTVPCNSCVYGKSDTVKIREFIRYIFGLHRKNGQSLTLCPSGKFRNSEQLEARNSDEETNYLPST